MTTKDRYRTVELTPETRVLIQAAEDSNGCWQWQGRVNKDGYGKCHFYGETLAHRATWLITKGDIPTGLELDHKCLNRRCVNPDHLEPVTHLENVARTVSLTKQATLRTHCPKGHPFTIRNTYIAKSGGRMCKTCGRENQRRRTGVKIPRATEPFL